MRALPQRIVIERGGRRTELDPANVPAELAAAIGRLLDETRPPATAAPDSKTYDLVLDYGDREERLRYAAADLPEDVRNALDSHL